MLFSLDNLPYWILLTIGVGLFLLVILAGVGEEDADIDADLDADIDADSPGLVSPDGNGDAEGMDPTLQILTVLGVGKSPLILLLAIDFSTWGLAGWFLSVMLSTWVGSSLPMLVHGGILLVSLVAGLVTGGWLSHPIGKVLAQFGEDTRSERLLGLVGRVTSASIPRKGQIGQVDVLDGANNFVTVSAILPEWATTIPLRGEEVLLIEQEEGTFVVICVDSPDQSRWLSQVAPRPLPPASD
ncbi:MAG: YqiJ family protein [Synechococcaceae cyanobacterium SM2_3_2]|nr:YqiJ family protein [Synechococcaceae cyanobacterium SM2_3_2]